MDFQYKGIWLNDKKPTSLTEIVGNHMICNLLSKYIETGQLPNILFVGENGVGKRTLARIFCKTYLGENYGRGCLVIDGAIERGKDIISENVQEFARRRVTMDKRKLILITNFDSMTHEAQNALRRIMELEQSVRFVFTTNDTTEIIEAIQSRCTILKVKELTYEESLELIKNICTIPEDIADIISLISEGDMKRIINYCQTVSVDPEPTLDKFYSIFNIPPIKHVQEILQKVHRKEAVFEDIDYLMDQGHNYNDIIDIMTRLLAYKTDVIPDEVRYKYLGIISDHYSEMSASTIRLHMYALLSKLAIDGLV